MGLLVLSGINQTEFKSPDILAVGKLIPPSESSLFTASFSVFLLSFLYLPFYL